ncbi:MAG: phosphoribosylanthranilate isomerase [Flavobacteriaceae bacterium]|nr:phosphoribosylanthranilate isomerase [Flavobacteriaceae bacterium]
MKLKVCGMKYNSEAVAELRFDYLGFIFWEPSSRFFDRSIPQLPDSIKKIGVFVDAPIVQVREAITDMDLYGVQLHGSETVEYCRELRKSGVKVIKVFSIKNDFDFDTLGPYEGVCDYYLFDTKGKLPGGNGYRFDWKVLNDYPSTKPYFLSGGIGLEEEEALKGFLASDAARYCHAIDVNSRFETEPGLKDIEKLNDFKKLLENELSR